MVDLLVTGAAGQLGWETIRRAPEHGLTVSGVARDGLDITDRDAVRTLIERLRPAVILNAAAYTAVDRAEEERAAAFAVNADAPGHLAEAAEATGAALIHISTDYVFDGSATRPSREDDPTGPLGVYGASKRAGEEAVAARCPRHAILRTAWVYGVEGRNFVRTMLRLGAERDHLRVVDDQRGSPTFAGDLARACLTLATRLRDRPAAEPGWGIFHAAGRGEATWCGFARAIFEQAGTRLAQVPRIEAITTADFPTPAQRPAYSVLDTTRLAETHGIRFRPWQEALGEMLDETLSKTDAEGSAA